MSFFVFDIIEIECELDYSIFSEIGSWAYSRVFTVVMLMIERNAPYADL
jgi:hypothetical protein